MSESRDLLQRIARVGAAIDPGLTDRDVERLVGGARGRARRRRVARAAVVAATVGLASLFFVLRPITGSRGIAPTRAKVPAPTAPLAADRTPARPAPLRLADGSVATPLDDGSAIALRESTGQRVIVDLTRGRGRFEVTPRAERQFSVRAGDVTITVLGTVFTVERVADRIGVGVERGRVLVDWGAGSRRLDVGESGWFPPLATTSDPQPPSQPRPRRASPEPQAEAMPPPPQPEAASSRAPPAPATQPPAQPPPATTARDEETAETLLAAADAARLDGRARDGAALLQRVLTHHGADPRAPLAAFTLGRVLLMDLGEPRQAAAAFAQARTLAPSGPFAEDALAREVEALAKAGDGAATRSRARDYLRLYPNGRRAPAVRALGGGGE